jgi:hypothetical protein
MPRGRPAPARRRNAAGDQTLGFDGRAAEMREAADRQRVVDDEQAGRDDLERARRTAAAQLSPQARAVLRQLASDPPQRRSHSCPPLSVSGTTHSPLRRAADRSAAPVSVQLPSIERANRRRAFRGGQYIVAPTPTCSDAAEVRIVALQQRISQLRGDQEGIMAAQRRRHATERERDGLAARRALAASDALERDKQVSLHDRVAKQNRVLVSETVTRAQIELSRAMKSFRGEELRLSRM